MLNIPFPDDSFDIVIANMMLYHVPNLAKGLSEVRRVLKKGGTFYCATYKIGQQTDISDITVIEPDIKQVIEKVYRSELVVKEESPL